MKNKYFEELREMGFEEEITDYSDDPDFTPSPESADDPEEVPRTFRVVLILMAGLFAAEEAAVFGLMTAFLPDKASLKYACMLGLLLGSLIGALIFYLMKLQVVKITGADPEDRSLSWKLKIGAVLRILLVAGAAAGALFIRAVNPIALIFGVLNLKAAVLLYPLFGKRSEKKTKTERNIP